MGSVNEDIISYSPHWMCKNCKIIIFRLNIVQDHSTLNTADYSVGQDNLCLFWKRDT